MILDLLIDGFFAAVAAIGFGAISNPPLRAFSRIAILAAIGHSLRFFLMNYMDCDIAFSSFNAAFLIGIISLVLAKQVRCPMTCLYIPALLPMIPGIYAYKTVFSLFMFMQSVGSQGEECMEYMHQFFLNATVSFSVIVLLAVGASLPVFFFKDKAYSMTRNEQK